MAPTHSRSFPPSSNILSPHLSLPQGAGRKPTSLDFNDISYVVGERKILDGVSGSVKLGKADWKVADGIAYQQVPYEDRMHLLLDASDVAVTRSGGSVFELMAAGLPAVLVPLPIATRDHQMANAEAVGAMEAMHKDTIEYLKTRKQFGVPIGNFQVLQHRMVDCFTNAQEARSMTLMASLKIDDKDPVVRAKAASGAKVHWARTAEEASQIVVALCKQAGAKRERDHREVDAAAPDREAAEPVLPQRRGLSGGLNPHGIGGGAADGDGAGGASARA